ncbi:hypothetical protein PtA15_18A211 [Puccinia triticina]|uniref:Uncharacterized protein n=1 Tax=Puccinia triticina TaxID=208348 RepID=A0ABY7D7U9_9BASI|nr:uncharacterized protein PtA15_18A211 [Puccinia triticina]WAQ93153.1 hypothetical protein PtA15_18A211 [Puccinia triticina]
MLRMVQVLLAVTFVLGAFRTAQCLALHPELPPQSAAIRTKSSTAGTQLAPGQAELATDLSEKLQRPPPSSRQTATDSSLQKGWTDGSASKIDHKTSVSHLSRGTGSRIRKKRGFEIEDVEAMDRARKLTNKRFEGKLASTHEPQPSSSSDQSVFDCASLRNELPNTSSSGGRRSGKIRSESVTAGSSTGAPVISKSRWRDLAVTVQAMSAFKDRKGIAKQMGDFLVKNSAEFKGIAQARWRKLAVQFQAIQALTPRQIIMKKVGEALEKAEAASLPAVQSAATWADFYMEFLIELLENVDLEGIIDAADLWFMWCVAKSISHGSDFVVNGALVRHAAQFQL